MAIQQVYVYSFTVHLKSQQFPGGSQGGGFHLGLQVQAVGPTSAAAKAVLQQQFGADLALIVGGNQVFGTKPYTTLA